MCQRSMSPPCARSLDGWNAHDFDERVTTAHPDLEWTSRGGAAAPGQQPLTAGSRSSRRDRVELGDAIWEVRIEVMEIVDVGDDKVFVLGCTDARGGVSGVSLKQPIAYVYEFEDGMARRVRSYIDPDRARAAVGLPSAAP